MEYIYEFGLFLAQAVAIVAAVLILVAGLVAIGQKNRAEQHEGHIEIRNLNAVHYTRLRSVEHMREAYRAVQRGVFDLDTIFAHSVTRRLDEIADVFAQEAQDPDAQRSLKTIILP